MQAAVVEIADEVVSVVTPELMSLRALRRNLGLVGVAPVRKPDAVHVLINTASRADEVQPETVRRLSPGRVLGDRAAGLGRKLETAMNSRSPELVVRPDVVARAAALGA